MPLITGMFSEVLGILLGVAVFGAIIAPYRVVTSCEESLYRNASGSIGANTTIPSTASKLITPEAKESEVSYLFPFLLKLTNNLSN